VSTQYRHIEVANCSVDWIAPTLNNGIPQGTPKLSLKLHTGQLGPIGWLLRRGLYLLLFGKCSQWQEACRGSKEYY
jgi:hypothetical protein